MLLDWWPLSSLMPQPSWVLQLPIRATRRELLGRGAAHPDKINPSPSPLPRHGMAAQQVQVFTQEMLGCVVSGCCWVHKLWFLEKGNKTVHPSHAKPFLMLGGRMDVGHTAKVNPVGCWHGSMGCLSGVCCHFSPRWAEGLFLLIFSAPLL